MASTMNSSVRGASGRNAVPLVTALTL